MDRNPCSSSGTNSPAPPSNPDTDTYRHTLVHPSPGAHPLLSFDKRPAHWAPEKIDTCRRIIRAYKASAAQTDEPLKSMTESDLWTGITNGHLADLLQLVEREDAEALSHYLDAFGSGYVWFGGITTGVDGFNHWDQSESAVAFSYFDKLVCLAEAIGALPTENPEQGPAGNWGRNIRRSPNEVVAAIQQVLGIDIHPPLGVIPVAGLVAGDGIFHYRHINAIYTASRIRDLVAPPDRICEYGGGLGIVSFYLYRMGYRSVTLFDIPTTNLLSAYYLIGALGAEQVTLEGESLRPGTVAIRANWNCVHAPDGHFAITVNQDSFPEINQTIFDAYVREIERTTTRWFLSINHEVEHEIVGGGRHLNVSKRLSGRPGWKRLSRSPYWLRRGYVEELYAISRSESR